MTTQTGMQSAPVDRPCYVAPCHIDGRPMQDLYLLNEVLMLLLNGVDWEELENRYNSTGYAIARLRNAYEAGVLHTLNLSLANYFDRTGSIRGGQ